MYANDSISRIEEGERDAASRSKPQALEIGGDVTIAYRYLIHREDGTKPWLVPAIYHQLNYIE